MKIKQTMVDYELHVLKFQKLKYSVIGNTCKILNFKNSNKLINNTK